MAYADIKDYTSITQGRLTDFFTNKDVFWHYVNLITQYSQALQEEIVNVGLNRWIDSAQGEQLDILGRIVGQDRTLYGYALQEWFGYYPFLTAQAYGDENDPSVGGYYRDENTAVAGDVRLSDEQYRIFIRGKIMKNTIVPTPENIITFIKFVFDVSSVRITNNGCGSVDIRIYSDNLTTFEKAILLYSYQGKTFINYFIPKTLGVQYNITIEDIVAGTFGFFGDTTAEGFGSIENDNGGIWASYEASS